MMGEIRAFIAIELPDDTKAALSRLLDQLKPGYERSVKWVQADSIHLTLKFLGNIPDEMIVDITTVVSRAILGIPPFSLKLHGLGAFPNLRSPRVVWAGIAGDIPQIVKVQKRIDEALIPLGFTPEKRAFSPHLTLGRVRERTDSAERSNLGKAIEALEVSGATHFSVERVSLMKSTLTSSGAIYDQLATFILDMS